MNLAIVCLSSLGTVRVSSLPTGRRSMKPLPLGSRLQVCACPVSLQPAVPSAGLSSGRRAGIGCPSTLWLPTKDWGGCWGFGCLVG